MRYQDSEISYVAGLFDAIGNIKIRVMKGKEEMASLVVWVTSSNFQIMEYLQHFKASIDRKDERQFKAKWHNKKAYDFLRLIAGHSRLKKEQVEVGIEFFDNKMKNVDPQNYVLPLKVRLRLLKKEDPNT